MESLMRRNRLGLILVLLMAVGAPAGSFGFDDKIVVEAIRKRENKIKCLDVIFEMVEVHPNGSPEFQSDPTSDEWSQDRQELKTRVKLRAQGESARISSIGQSWDINVGRVIKSEWLVTYADGIKESFYSQHRGVDANAIRPVGIRSKLKKDQNWGDFYSVMPMRYYYRMSDVLDLDSVKLHDKAVLQQGLQCVRVSQTVTPTVTKSWLLDTNRDYLPVYFEFKVQDEFLLELEYKYADAKRQDAWTLIGWSIKRSESIGNGRFNESNLTAKIKSFELNNELPADVFTMEFPMGTRVADHTGAKRSVYVVTEDGDED